MNLFEVFQSAYEEFDLEIGADARSVKRAYRMKIKAHPPDKDPERFRKIRKAYELITEPYEPVHNLLNHPTPLIDPPKKPKVSAPPEIYALLLRRIAQKIDAKDLLKDIE